MDPCDLSKDREALEHALRMGGRDFAGTYLAVGSLREFIRTRAECVIPETIRALNGVLTSSQFSHETQSFFLYRETADALASIIVSTNSECLAGEGISALTKALSMTRGDARRAIARALGSLPIVIQGPGIAGGKREDVPHVGWGDILREVGISNGNSPALIGRSIVTTIDNKKRLLVVKLASARHSLEEMYREAAWMEHFHSWGYSFPVRFNIPTAIRIQGRYVFRLENLPPGVLKRIDLHPDCYAIGFLADREYFTYPNDHRAERRLTSQAFREVMFRNAWLLGRLTFLGIVHSAPIPLFHNRMQQDRRDDRGLYEWPRRGRLDRWLDSCRYPNFGMTGIRDFEHLVTLNGSGQDLHHHIGTQLLSLLLVTGSYFRHKDGARVGLDEQGNPTDARDLFEQGFLGELIEGILLRYYNGFVGRKVTCDIPLNVDELSARMIEEMGVDRYMEEILRVVDQEEMSDVGFAKFLEERGYSEAQIRGLGRGVEDITVYTGPHLGGFNERISLPELIECVETMAALCVVGRYEEETFPSRPC